MICPYRSMWANEVEYGIFTKLVFYKTFQFGQAHFRYWGGGGNWGIKFCIVECCIKAACLHNHIRMYFPKSILTLFALRMATTPCYPFALRTAKTLWDFGHSECRRVN